MGCCSAKPASRGSLGGAETFQDGFHQASNPSDDRAPSAIHAPDLQGIVGVYLFFVVVVCSPAASCNEFADVVTPTHAPEPSSYRVGVTVCGSSSSLSLGFFVQK